MYWQAVVGSITVRPGETTMVRPGMIVGGRSGLKMICGGTVTMTGGMFTAVNDGKQIIPRIKLVAGRSPIMYGVKPAPDDASACGASPIVFATGASVGCVAAPGGVVDGGFGVAGGAGAGVDGGACVSVGSRLAGSAAIKAPDAKPAHSPTAANN
jgi:hypothetical protein